MSIKIMSSVWDSSLPTHTQKIVLLSLSDQANDHGECWPSIDSIARRCDLSRQGVMDQIEKLQSAGFLRVETGGGRRSNRYTVVVNAVDHKPDSVAVNGVDPSSQRRLPQQSTPDTVVVNGVDSIRKEPSLNPHRTNNPFGEDASEELFSDDTKGSESEPPVKPPFQKKSAAVIRIGNLFRRRESTRWSERELKLIKSLEPIPEEELKLIEDYYNAKHPPDADYRRRDLLTLLNNWSGEVDRARKYKPKMEYNL